METHRSHRKTGRSQTEHYASLTPEQRAERRRNISLGVKRWHASRTEAEREVTRQRLSDAAVCKMWTAPPHHGNPKGRTSLSTNSFDPDRLALRRVQKASVKAILKDIAETQPDLIRHAILKGLLAEPPRSFPYVALAAAYLDGKPVNSSDAIHANQTTDLSSLSNDQLLSRAVAIAARLQSNAQERADLARERAQRVALPIIDVTAEGER